jgi:mannose/fructose/N-acetylgalactosamine-specific phosphotransferase system component IID
MTAPGVAGISLPLRVKLAMFLRLLAVQGSWNYETLLGTGIGFAMEPALRYLPGGVDGDRKSTRLNSSHCFHSY